jgi:hypothetical protein
MEIYLVVIGACAILVGAGLYLALTDSSQNRQLVGVGLMTAGAMGVSPPSPHSTSSSAPPAPKPPAPRPSSSPPSPTASLRSRS